MTTQQQTKTPEEKEKKKKKKHDDEEAAVVRDISYSVVLSLLQRNRLRHQKRRKRGNVMKLFQ